ncbi:unnamed protein product [Clavelina lepadiformis]|uniref:EF-hand domain-containing protein n=1 Tax=Clavelina lepadiformis TaxID=159417 RepID=A0ABP0F4M8_CLALP
MGECISLLPFSGNYTFNENNRSSIEQYMSKSRCTNVHFDSINDHPQPQKSFSYEADSNEPPAQRTQPIFLRIPDVAEQCKLQPGIRGHGSGQPTTSIEKKLHRPEVEIDGIFQFFDRDQNGVVDIEDLKTILHLTQNYASDSEVNNIVKDINKNGNDFIGFDDFQDFSKAELEGCPENALRDAFKIFDADEDGFIGKNDLRNLVTVLLFPPSEEDLENLMEEADRKGDGRIDFEDFVLAIGVGS